MNKLNQTRLITTLNFTYLTTIIVKLTCKKSIKFYIFVLLQNINTLFQDPKSFLDVFLKNNH